MVVQWAGVFVHVAVRTCESVLSLSELVEICMHIRRQTPEKRAQLGMVKVGVEVIFDQHPVSENSSRKHSLTQTIWRIVYRVHAPCEFGPRSCAQPTAV